MTEFMQDVMFICGAQTTPDGDMLPGSFSVFSRLTDSDDAIGIIVERILDELTELNIDEAAGSLAFEPIRTWEEFAAIKIDDHVKMEALAVGLVSTFMDTVAGRDAALTVLVTKPWVPDKD